MPTTESSTKRIQFEVNEDRVEDIEELKHKLDLRTKTDLMNNALALLSWAVKQKEEGRKIASIDEQENSYRELVMPSLNSVPIRV
jgi:hypothetical protein